MWSRPLSRLHALLHGALTDCESSVKPLSSGHVPTVAGTRPQPFPSSGMPCLVEIPVSSGSLFQQSWNQGGKRSIFLEHYHSSQGGCISLAQAYSGVTWMIIKTKLYFLIESTPTNFREPEILHFYSFS